MFHETINKIKNGYHHNFLYSKIKFNKNEFILIKIFIKLGVIKSIFKKNNFYYVRYFYNKNNKIHIKNIFKPSNKKFIKLKTLKNLTLNKGWILILSTNKGVMTSVEAVRKNIGGLILVKIFN